MLPIKMKTSSPSDSNDPSTITGCRPAHALFSWAMGGIFLIFLGSLLATAAPLTPRTNINPAVLYWQGFSLFPDLPANIRKELFAEPPRLPLADAEAPLKKLDQTFRFLRRAAQMQVRCDWG